MRHVAIYRAAMTIHLDDPAWTGLPARLAQLSPDFARFWASSDVADDPMIRIVILYPATASDAAKLERLGLSD